jgi:exocyst complex component 2
MRDYNKGKFMLESRSGQLLPITAGKDSKPAPDAEQQRKRILDKVWSSVERTMSEMKGTLLSQLQDSSKSVEEHEKTLEYVSFLLSVDLRLTSLAQSSAGVEHDGRTGVGVL